MHPVMPSCCFFTRLCGRAFRKIVKKGISTGTGTHILPLAGQTAPEASRGAPVRIFPLSSTLLFGILGVLLSSWRHQLRKTGAG